MPAQGKSAAEWREPTRRIEVNRVLDDDGTSRILLQDMSFGLGVGWYVQKTIELDGEHVDALLRKLCCNRDPCQKLHQPGMLNTGRRTGGASENSDAVIDFKKAARKVT